MSARPIAAFAAIALFFSAPAAADEKAKKAPVAKKADDEKKAAKKAKITPEQAESLKKLKRLKAKRKFWTWLADPHGREIKVILSKVEQNRQIARNMQMFNYQGAFQPESLAEKQRAYNDALGMLKYARKLDAKSKPVLAALAEVAHEIGRTQESIDAYKAFLALPNERNEKYIAHHSTLGTLYAEREQWDKAAEHLEIAISGGVGAYSTVGLTYALVEMERGNLEKAIDFLVNIQAIDGSFIQLTLAVAYDRNDEESKAQQTLDIITRSQATSQSISPPYGTDLLPFTPTYDMHYFRALLYEGSGHLAEARAEWLAYVRADEDARYREKALSHIADIDKLENTRPANKPQTIPGVPGGIPGGIPIP